MKDVRVPQPPRCLPLESVGDREGGGKAHGLSRLIRLGLRVPPGFVVLGASPGNLPDTLPACYSELAGGPVAVRSSARGEDSPEASFAGQYQTLLDVEGLEELRKASRRFHMRMPTQQQSQQLQMAKKRPFISFLK
jgi:hypothetical protein